MGAQRAQVNDRLDGHRNLLGSASPATLAGAAAAGNPTYPVFAGEPIPSPVGRSAVTSGIAEGQQPRIRHHACHAMLTDEPATTRDDTHAALRRDIRELGVLLGRTLVRQEGEHVLDLVERVRRLVRTERDTAAAVLSEVDALTATRLVRAFTTYFHLAN